MEIMKPQQLYFKGRGSKQKKGKKMQKYLERCDMVLTLMELAQEPAHTQTGC
jgi:hypothetical protein